MRNSTLQNTFQTSTLECRWTYGMGIKSRAFQGFRDFRYGFGSQEKDDEISGKGNMMTAEYWEYDTRLGRRWNIDPKTKEYFSPYFTFAGNPILHNDIKGDDHYKLSKDGSIKKVATTKDKKDYLFDEGIKKFVVIDKGILDKMIFANAGNKPLKTFLITDKIDELKKIYEFAAINSNVEWGLITLKGKGNKQVSILGTDHSSESSSVGRNIVAPVMEKYKNLSIVSYSHSHPGNYIEASQWPAYPSGFNRNLEKTEVKEKGGDRKNYERFVTDFPGRIPTYFDIFIPSHPEINILYNDKEVFRFNMPPIPPPKK